MDAAGGEHGAVDVGHRRVRDLLVRRAALLVEPPKRRFVLRERTVGSPGPLPRRVDVDVDVDRDRVRSQRPAHRRGRHGTAAERQHGPLARLEVPDRPLLLDCAKRRFPVLAKVARDVVADLVLDDGVDIGLRQPDPRCELAHQGRLARPHEPDQRDVTA